MHKKNNLPSFGSCGLWTHWLLTVFNSEEGIPFSDRNSSKSIYCKLNSPFSCPPIWLVLFQRLVGPRKAEGMPYPDETPVFFESKSEIAWYALQNRKTNLSSEIKIK